MVTESTNLNLTSVEALERDIGTLNDSILKLEAKREILQKALAIVQEMAGLLPSVKEVPKSEVTLRATKGGAMSKFDIKRLRDVFVNHPDEEFFFTDLAFRCDTSVSTIKKYISELLDKKIIVECERKPLPGQRSGIPNRVFKYNSELPPGPKERPHQPPPERSLIGAPVTLRNQQVSNRRVSSKHTGIQELIDIAEAQEWTVTQKTGAGHGRHLKFTAPNNTSVHVTDTDDSHIQALMRRDLRRAGMNV